MPGEADYEFERASLLAAVPVMVKKGIYEEVNANLIQTISDHFDSVITTASIVAARTNALAPPSVSRAAPH